MLIPTEDNVKTVTDMREDALGILNYIKNQGAAYIFHHSKPKAVILDIEEFVKIHELMEDYIDQIEAIKLTNEERGKGIPLEKILKEYV